MEGGRWDLAGEIVVKMAICRDEFFGAEAEQGRAIDFGLAAYEVSLLRMEELLVDPHIFRVVAVVEEDSGGVPVEFFLGKKGSTLEDEDAFACVREIEGESSAAGSGSDDGVVLVGHWKSFQFWIAALNEGR